MPSKSKAQARLMAAVAHNPAFAKKVGISQAVGKEFNQADKGRKFRSGGMAEKESKKEMRKEMKVDTAQDKKLIKKAFRMHDSQEHKGSHTNLSKLKKGGQVMKAGAMPRTMAGEVEKGSNKLTKFGESAVQKRAHTKGKNLGDSGKSIGIEGGAKRMCKGGMAGGGTASKRADGIASKGKTKGRFV